MPTIQDVARMAKVSIATVSRVINNSPHKVNWATRERVLEAIRELDYRPNALAQGLILKRTMTIGIIIPDISNPYYAEIVRGMHRIGLSSSSIYSGKSSRMESSSAAASFTATKHCPP
jgi:LacI family transcriptional regulator